MSPWQLWVDTGGTFTDCLAITPEGELRRLKVLSSASVRGRVSAVLGPRALSVDQPFEVGVDFYRGYRLELPGAVSRGDDEAVEVTAFEPRQGRFELARPIPAPEVGALVALVSPEEAPLLAARLMCDLRLDQGLEAVRLRLATTRGTNALLERKGGPTAFFVTRGHADLLRIGNQARADLFALDVRRPAPLYHRVIEVDERIDADGEVIEAIDLPALEGSLAELRAAGVRSAAVALLHSYREPRHERQLADFLRQRGLRWVTCSHDVAPMIKIVPRAETAVVDAYLAEIVERYVEAVASRLPGRSLHLMTSAGGLVQASSFHPRDSLLSGPAGGVVGAAYAARAAGLERIVGFDMGGTSTDVARYDGDFEYVFEHRVGDAHIVAPALAIETVAAGGGSICSFDGRQLKVGPESAGAEPGPACYGAGGPLSLTDVNLLLGRLDPERFEIPIDAAASRVALDRLLEEIERETGEAPASEAVLQGFLDIANERMADAIRRISVQKGYDPRDHALISFGGAGGQHAVAIAAALGIDTVVVPPDASLLSAVGLGAAVIERFVRRQMLAPLDDLEGDDTLSRHFEEMDQEAQDRVAEEGIPNADVRIRRRWLQLRLVGQDSTIEVEWQPDADPRAGFEAVYRRTYGYPPGERTVEVESLGVVASAVPRRQPVVAPSSPLAGGSGEQRAWFEGRWQRVPRWHRDELGETPVEGPGLVVERHSVTVLPSGWRLHRQTASGALIVERR